MKRFKITLMVPHSKEIVVTDAQAAHNEATRLAAATVQDGPKALVHSVEELEDVQTEPVGYELEFGADIPE